MLPYSSYFECGPGRKCNGKEMNTGHNVPAGYCEIGGGVENRAVGTQGMGLEQISSLGRQNRPGCFSPLL